MPDRKARVTVVTGGGSGIGRALCERLGSAGSSVVAVDVSAERLAWTESAISIAPCVADIATEEGNAAMIAMAIERFGRLSDVALNAGVDLFGTVDTQSMADFDRLISVNLRGVVLGIRAALPELRRNGSGAIVLTSSMGGLVGQYGRSAYGIAKAGLVNLARSVAMELGPDRIRVNAVCPGPIAETGLSAGIEQRRPDVHRYFVNATALKRFGQPGEVAAAIDFLLSDEASYITGVALSVDGGAVAGDNLCQTLGVA